MEKHDVISLQICAPRLAGGARGAFLRLLTHPALAGVLGFVITIDGGLLPAALAGALAALVAVWGWASHARAARTARALLGAISRRVELARVDLLTQARAARRAARLLLDSNSSEKFEVICRARLGAVHLALAPRLSPRPRPARA